MFKAPSRAKARLRSVLGPAGTAAAACLLDCALEDLADRPGPIFYAAAEPADLEWLLQSETLPGNGLLQGTGNLGERIETVCAAVSAFGHARQILIGSDCPAIHRAYLEQAAAALADSDMVIGPAADGGAVLLATGSGWPALDALPWSEAGLRRALSDLCRSDGKSVTELAGLRDIDLAADMLPSLAELAGDDRPARVALRRFIEQCPGLPADHRAGAAW
jgi:glycosyltransferase A (GT-A) superfamily protein (DUF2064 family)